MKFVDYVTITARSGKGGAGSVAFRRAKYEPRGGPWGGDGGRGGSVIIEADRGLYTLLDLRYNRHPTADNGRPGSGGNQTGKDGADIVLRVPLGTVAQRHAPPRRRSARCSTTATGSCSRRAGAAARATPSSSPPPTRPPSTPSPASRARSAT